MTASGRCKGGTGQADVEPGVSVLALPIAALAAAALHEPAAVLWTAARHAKRGIARLSWPHSWWHVLRGSLLQSIPQPLPIASSWCPGSGSPLLSDRGPRRHLPAGELCAVGDLRRVAERDERPGLPPGRPLRRAGGAEACVALARRGAGLRRERGADPGDDGRQLDALARPDPRGARRQDGRGAVCSRVLTLMAINEARR